MNKKDVFEIKSRLKKTGCTFTRMCGCYVNAEKEILVNFNETFLNLEEDEYYKYLEVAKKTLSGTMGNNLLELNFPLDEERAGGKQQFLMGLRESKLKNEGLLETFYQLIIDNYEYAGNYLILAFHDAYDVMTKTTDNRKLDESEEVYEYVLFTICPVTLTKPGLGYLENENRIGARNRDWAVGVPETGFVFPAFTERSTDIHSVMFYTKNPKEPHKELMELVLGCPAKSTAVEQKNTFHSIIKNAINDSEKSSKVLIDIQESLSVIAQEQAACSDSLEEPVILTNQSVQEILMESGLPEDITVKIETAYAENFDDEPPVISHLIDKKELAENEKRKVERALMERVERLQEQLADTTKAVNTSTSLDDTNYDVVLQVKPEKMDQIKSQIIDGKQCIIIPMDENEHATVNGVVSNYFELKK
ncbi:MAG: DUF4317 domain-containing protein [Velocimicrobium sp.]